MLIQSWIEKVAHAAFCSSKFNEIIVSAKSPMHLSAFIRQKYDIKQHQAGFLIRFTNSHFALFLLNADDVPMNDIIDPQTGRYLIKYDDEHPIQMKPLIRID